MLFTRDVFKLQICWQNKLRPQGFNYVDHRIFPMQFETIFLCLAVVDSYMDDSSICNIIITVICVIFITYWWNMGNIYFFFLAWCDGCELCDRWDFFDEWLFLWISINSVICAIHETCMLCVLSSIGNFFHSLVSLISV